MKGKFNKLVFARARGKGKLLLRIGSCDKQHGMSRFLTKGLGMVPGALLNPHLASLTQDLQKFLSSQKCPRV